ncbi:MAG: 30S ribosomal protein S5 [Planctomycetes bacterium]|nr:30S ribosomal protein S5 [Planctomycetota bacterium]
MATPRDVTVEERGEWIENVVRIYRCATVMKGGRRFSFSALVVVGDGKGRVGIGYGKANEVPAAVEKGMKDARKHLVSVVVSNGTIPHEVTGRYQASRVIMAPASPGTGIKAGGGVRAVLEAAGIHNILTKCHRTSNPKNAVKAAMDGLQQLRTKEWVERLRGVTLS